MSDPISMAPESTRMPPNQRTATLETLSTSINTGNIAAIHRPTMIETSVRSVLALSNRALSNGSRTKARSTRMPAVCSLSTRLTVSMRSCITR